MAEPPTETMRTVVAWIDDLREAFGVDVTLNTAIRTDMPGGARFSAEDGGDRIGCEPILVRRAINVAGGALSLGGGEVRT